MELQWAARIMTENCRASTAEGVITTAGCRADNAVWGRLQTLVRLEISGAGTFVFIGTLWWHTGRFQRKWRSLSYNSLRVPTARAHSRAQPGTARPTAGNAPR